MAKKTRDDYDGVIYEPSDYIDPRRGRASGARKQPQRRKGGAPASQRKAASGSQFTVFYIMTLVAAVTLCIVIFLVVFNSTTERRQDTPDAADPVANPSAAVTEPSSAPPVAIEETTMLLGFIQDVYSDEHQVKVLDIETGAASTLTADAATSLTSRFGQAMLFSEFRPGDIVEISHVTRTSVLKSMAVSSDSWEFRQVSDIRVDAVNQTVSYGSETYKFGRGFMVSYKDSPYSVADIRPMDVCTIRGYKDTVWSVDVLRSHGTLVIIGKDEIIDGLLEIDTDVFTMLDEFETMELVEGERRLVIKGANVEPFVSLVTINPGEVATVDLTEIQKKSGVLRLTVNESFYTLMIDGEIQSTSEPVVLQYGPHELQIEKDEFETWTGTLEVDAPTEDLDVTLQRIYKLGRLAVTSDPPGADILVDGVPVGKAPVNVPVEIGTHSVTASLEGYISITVAGEVKDAATPHGMDFMLQPQTVTAP